MQLSRITAGAIAPSRSKGLSDDQAGTVGAPDKEEQGNVAVDFDVTSSIQISTMAVVASSIQISTMAVVANCLCCTTAFLLTDMYMA